MTLARGSFHSSFTPPPEHFRDGRRPFRFWFLHSYSSKERMRVIKKKKEEELLKKHFLQNLLRFFIISFNCWSSSTSLVMTTNETSCQRFVTSDCSSLSRSCVVSITATSADPHPDPPRLRFCRPRSPPVSASTFSPAVAPHWTLNDLRRTKPTHFSFQV